MSIVEISCPKCSSQTFDRDKKIDAYYCKHCGASFRLIDPTKNEVVSDSRRHNCPECGRPVTADKSYQCKSCGEVDLCSKCTEEYDHKMFCRKCTKKEQIDCTRCGKIFAIKCNVCNTRRCKDCADIFDMTKNEYSPSRNQHVDVYYSIRCPKCGYLCSNCVSKTLGWTGIKYICNKCGHKVELGKPHTKKHISINLANGK